MQGATLTLDDFRSHLLQLRAMAQKMGGVRGLLRALPGLAQMPDEAPVRFDEQELARFDAAFDSMTLEERSDADLLLDGPRRSRVAKGAGVAVSTVEALLTSFYGIRRVIENLTRS